MGGDSIAWGGWLGGRRRSFTSGCTLRNFASSEAEWKRNKKKGRQTTTVDEKKTFQQQFNMIGWKDSKKKSKIRRLDTAALPPVAASRVSTELRPKMKQQAPTFSRVLLGSPFFSRVLLGSPVFSRDLLGSPVLSRVLLSSPFFSSLLLGSPATNPGFSTGFFEVLLGCYWFSFIQSDGSQSRVVLSSAG